MELGKIQKAWIKSLREHPERQGKSQLGMKHGNSYKACCLGELLLTSCRIKKKAFPFNVVGELRDKTPDDEKGCLGFLGNSWKKLGLKSDRGCGDKLVVVKGKNYSNLASANDNGATWPEIADAVEADPENFFTKSV